MDKNRATNTQVTRQRKHANLMSVWTARKWSSAVYDSTV